MILLQAPYRTALGRQLAAQRIFHSMQTDCRCLVLISAAVFKMSDIYFECLRADTPALFMSSLLVSPL